MHRNKCTNTKQLFLRRPRFTAAWLPLCFLTVRPLHAVTISSNIEESKHDGAHALLPAFKLCGVGPSMSRVPLRVMEHGGDETLPPAVAPDAIHNPIPASVVEAENADPVPLNDGACVECGSMLRESHALWRAMVQHLRPSAGSIATELVVIIDVKHRFGVPYAGARMPQLSMSMQRRLRELGVGVAQAEAISISVMEHVIKTNSRTLALARDVMEHKGTLPDVVVFRLALKPVSGLSVNLPTGAVWFNNGHANACVIDVRRRVMLVVEPTGMEFMPGILRFLADLIFGDRFPEFVVMHNHGLFPREALLTTVDKCTVWCAVACMLALANPVVTHEDFMCVLHWAYEHQHWLLRLFVRLYQTIRAGSM